MFRSLFGFWTHAILQPASSLALRVGSLVSAWYLRTEGYFRTDSSTLSTFSMHLTDLFNTYTMWKKTHYRVLYQTFRYSAILFILSRISF